MDKHVGIAVAKKAERVRNLYSAKPKVTTFHKLMYIKAESYTD